jgi:hypothetical protein
MDNQVNSTKEENINEITSNNHDWITALGEQSWQAELVLSGLIITGLFQLPDIFIHWVETLMIKSGEIEFSFLNLASIYLLIAIECLTIFFGVHLLFRGIWIALLGLNSVYPNGIDVKSKNGLGEKFWQKSKEKYPNLTAYIVELDANCSVLFSLATVTFIMSSSASILILVFYQCIMLLISIFPSISNHILSIGIGIFLIYILFTTTIQYLGKKYPDNKRIEKIATGYSVGMSTVFSLYFFRKPIGYITTIYTSNDKSKYLKYIFMFICAIMGYMGGLQMGESDIANNFNAEKYFVFNNKPHQIFAYNYENLLEKEAIIYSPIIQSDVISEDFVKVFIPSIEREVSQMNFKKYTIVE